MFPGPDWSAVLVDWFPDHWQNPNSSRQELKLDEFRAHMNLRRQLAPLTDTESVFHALRNPSN